MNEGGARRMGMIKTWKLGLSLNGERKQRGAMSKDENEGVKKCNGKSLHRKMTNEEQERE